MKLVFIFLLLLTSTATMAQDFITSQQLMNLFLIQKDSAMKFVEGKGYESYEPLISSPVLSKESALFFKGKDGSDLSILLDGNKILALLYSDSLKSIQRLLNEIRNSGWKMSKSKEYAYEVYRNEKKNFGIVYLIDTESNVYTIQIENLKR